MKKITSLIICMMLLISVVGCSSGGDKENTKKAKSTTDASSLDSSFYKIVNIGTSANREELYRSFYSNDDFVNIGRQLQSLSTSHYSTSDYYLSEGTQLKAKDMDKLLKRSSDPKEYPYTLQPQKGTSVENVSDPIMVSSIYEQDYYSKDGDSYTLEGTSFGIIISPRDSNNNVLNTPMADSTMKNYGDECIKTLYKYLQTKKDLKKIPANICVYIACDSDTNDYNGRYVSTSYCNGSQGSVSDVDFSTYIFTSDEATKNDEETASKFDIFKNNIKNEGYEAVGVVGYGQYEDSSLSNLKIEITVNTKTYTELVYLVSYTADQIDKQFGSSYDIKVTVNYQDGLAAVIIRDKGSNSVSYMMK